MAAAVGCIIATTMMTGGAHEVGLARTADALAGGAPAARALDIMKCPGLASHGVLALTLALLSKVSLLAVFGRPVAGCGHGRPARCPCALAFWPLLLPAGFPGWATRALTNRLQTESIPAAWPSRGVVGRCGGDRMARRGRGLCNPRTGRRRPCVAVDQQALRAPAAGLHHSALGATQQVCEIATYLGAAIGLRVG